ncbi:hypothetical protein [Sphingomonas sp. SRS2]|uniref:hypothetical protein n=1 Tax=Sphingomonas sp. SRS2 TaxID=133190 RepID=UPI0006983E4D|nr:hypothetical protein [Sphingomonas sp. SRS2]
MAAGAAAVGFIDAFKSVAFETYRFPASGRLEQRWLGRPIHFRMPIIGQTATEQAKLPTAWWVLAGQTEVVERLTLHGIRFEVIPRPRTLTFDHVRILDPKLKLTSEGRIPVEARLVHEDRTTTLPAGTLRVPSDQPLDLLAAVLLEPKVRIRCLHGASSMLRCSRGRASRILFSRQWQTGFWNKMSR